MNYINIQSSIFFAKLSHSNYYGNSAIKWFLKIFFSSLFLGNKTIKWLGEEALKRYLKLKPPSYVPNRQEVVHDIRKTVGGAICDPEDLLCDVLDDNDFVSIGT